MDRAVTRIAAAFLGVCGAMAASCGGPAKEGVQGATCFRASECSAGLVCIADATGAKVCTSDLTRVDLHEEGGAAGGAMAMMPAGDASTPGAGGASGSAGAGNAGGASGAGGGKAGSGGGAGKGGAGGSGMAGTAGSGMAGAGNDNDAAAE